MNLSGGISLLLIGLLLNVAGVSSVYADSKEEKEARFVVRVREGIRRLGTGTEARVEVGLRNRTKLKGYVGEASRESFTVVDDKGTATQVAYPQVRQVKGNNLSEGVKIAIGVGIAVAAIILAAVIFGGG